MSGACQDAIGHDMVYAIVDSTVYGIECAIGDAIVYALDDAISMP